jgi:hypothetical protein
MVHNFGHILLYRPFLHYLARTRDDKPPDPRHLRCATACVKVSRFTIAKSDEMLKQGFFLPAAWQSVYTVFLALVTLVFFLATQRGNKEYAAIQRDTECGIRILARTSCQEIGSRRCLDVLKVSCAVGGAMLCGILADYDIRYSSEDYHISSTSMSMRFVPGSNRPVGMPSEELPRPKHPASQPARRTPLDLLLLVTTPQPKQGRSSRLTANANLHSILTSPDPSPNRTPNRCPM